MGQQHLNDAAAAAEDADLSAIRSLLAEEGGQPAPRGKTVKTIKLKPSKGAAVAQEPDAPSKAGAKRAFKALPPQEEPAERPEPRAAKLLDAVKERAAGPLAQVRAYRPTPRHMFWASVVLIVLLRPWLAFGLAFLSLAALITAFLVYGSDRFWRGVLGGLKRIAVRQPELAARLQDRLDRFAMRWDALLDRLPDGWADDFYMPDFRGLAEADDQHAAAMAARLERLRSETAG